jgi:hypothetical protein
MERESELYREARRRVKDKTRFHRHLLIYVIFNAFLLFQSTFFHGNPLRPFPVIFFWGIGLLIHYLRVYGLPGNGIFSKQWEEREIQKEIGRLKGFSESFQKEEQLELKELRKNYDESELV